MKFSSRPYLHFFILVSILSIIGLLVMFESSIAESLAKFNHPYFFITQQLKWMGIGLICFFVGLFIPLTVWQKLSPLFFLGSLILLTAVFIPQLGVTINGATRWLHIGVLQFQPVEITKMGLVLFFASWMQKHTQITPFLLFTLIPLFILLIQPDFGSLLIIMGIATSMFVVAGGDIKFLLLFLFVGFIMGSILILTSEYRRERVTTFFHPEKNPLEEGYHTRQITIALGNGGLFGRGIGASRQKYQYIPEISSDSIFSIVAEETGFVGSMIVLVLFILTITSGFSIVKQTETKSFDYILGSGIMSWLALQILLNIAAVVILVPLTGIPLPFFSRGGSSLVMILFASGIMIRIGRDAQKQYNIKT